VLSFLESAATNGVKKGVSNSRSPIESNRQVLGGVPESEPSVSEYVVSSLIAPAKMIQAFSNTQFGSSLHQSQREENTIHSTMSRPDGPGRDSDGAVQRSQTLDSTSQSNPEESGPEIQDPLAGMNEIDKWGLKGFSFMMSSFPDYASMVAGENMAGFGFDLGSTEYENLLNHHPTMTF